jgi:Family of unknown function (DUF6084)
MTPLSLEVVGARVERHAAVPTIVVALRASVGDDVTVDALALRAQVRIEPQRRRYSAVEGERLYDQFGEAAQWGESLRPFLWTHVSTVAPRFTGTTVIELPLACTYDFEVAGTGYLHSLDDGEIPLLLLFAGTVFTSGPQGFSVAPIPWDLEASYRMPVALWRDTMDAYFPHSGWVRLDRDTLEELRRFRVSRGLPTWEQAVERLFKEAGEPVP